MSSKLLKSSLIFSAMTLISRVLGLVRDVVMASLMGAGTSSDVFIFANKIPNFLRRLFAEGAFAQAFVPVLTEWKETKPEDETRLLIARVSGTLGTVLLLTTIFAVIASPVLVAGFGTGWFIDWLNDGPDAAKYELASSMLKITFPYLFFISLVALSGAILNTYGKFGAAAFTPVLLNVVIITAAVGFADQFSEPAYALAWGVFFGGLVQLLFQLPFLYKVGALQRPQWGWNDEGVKRIRILMIPALFGVSVSQINLLLDTFLASFLEKGSISWLYFSDRLLEFPLGLFGIAISTVILPQLSRDHVNQTQGGFASTMDWGIVMVCLLGVPSALGLIALAEPMLMVLFMRGEFDAFATAQSAKSLVAYSCGLLSFMLIKVLATGFFSRQDTKTPVKIGIKTMVANMVFNLILIFPLAHVGLALATALSAAMNAFFLYWTLHKQGTYTLSNYVWTSLAKIFIAAGLMASALWYLMPEQNAWLGFSEIQRIVQLSYLIGAAAAIYLLSLVILGIRPRHLKVQKA
ncbi:murein biosynthesis integral membrane protein MurJ [Catenovulum sp. SM1970]|uniref:murein biosynthesis integral membrane protein MurJ n=1 Tax=Marinifaba aquimaris TaxID=2741323 RepID=UPI00157390CE|nr:murein biosynthesis integral membrane protein MurJ [Marinifaba aquimaris]NTS76700.1 murein biosynthesis integral membrane protein MurJ [Marinifaba aquimaris]